MSIAAWDPEVGARLAGLLADADAELERAERTLRLRSTPQLAHASPLAGQRVLHALALADEALVACGGARRRLADLQGATHVAAWSYGVAEQAARHAAELAGAVVANGLGSLMLGGLLLGLASLPTALPALAIGAVVAQTPLGGLLADLAGHILAPLAPALPELLNDPAFVDALALAVESADEALAGLTGQGAASPLQPILSQLAPDDRQLASGAGVALAVALLATGGRVRLPGALPTVAVRQPAPPPAQPPVDSYASAFERLSADGASIEVQRYERSDGTVVWQVLARGTASFAIDDPDTAYDLTANIENAANAGGALVGSAAAVEQALVDAGAADGDVIQLFGYSQGGAAVAAAAAYGRFEPATVVTFGAPVGATPVPEGTTAVAVQNDSDLVSALGGTHDPGRIVLEASPDLDAIATDRYGPGGQPLAEVAAGGHHPEAYADTAARLDASGDDVALAVWGEVDGAVADASAAGGLAYDVTR